MKDFTLEGVEPLKVLQTFLYELNNLIENGYFKDNKRECFTLLDMSRELNWMLNEEFHK